MSSVCSVRLITTIPTPRRRPGPGPRMPSLGTIAHIDLRDILHQHRNAVRLGQDDVLDVIDLVALGQIIVAAVVNQADAADVDGLLADADFASADVDVRVAQRGQDLRHRDVVGFQFVRIHLDLEFLGRAAPTVDLHDAGNGARAGAARSNPEPCADWSARNASARPPGNDRISPVPLFCWMLGTCAARKGDVLLQRDRRLAVGKVIVHAVLEDDADKGQAIERSGADDVDAGRRVESDLDGNRVVTLHLLGGQARRLRGDFQDDRRRVRIRLDVELLKATNPAPANSSKPNTTIARRLRQKAMMDLSMAGRTCTWDRPSRITL